MRRRGDRGEGLVRALPRRLLVRAGSRRGSSTASRRSPSWSGATSPGGRGRRTGWRGSITTSSGEFEEAFDKMERAEAIWRALQDPRLDPSWSTGYFHASLGDWERGIAECRGGLERAQDPLNTAAALGFLGYAFLEKGDLPPADRGAGGLRPAAAPGRDAAAPRLVLRLPGRGLSLLGASRGGRELAREALAVTEAVRFRYGSGIAQRALGRVARAAGDRARRRRPAPGGAGELPRDPGPLRGRPDPARAGPVGGRRIRRRRRRSSARPAGSSSSSTFRSTWSGRSGSPPSSRDPRLNARPARTAGAEP